MQWARHSNTDVCSFVLQRGVTSLSFKCYYGMESVQQNATTTSNMLENCKKKKIFDQFALHLGSGDGSTNFFTWVKVIK